MNDAVLALPFDQYQRYRLVADLLRQLRADGPPLRVLDVGGRTALLREFLDDARIDLVDVDPSQARGLVLGDGANLPFKDGSFDAVCAFDTLEHVPVPLRRPFVAECLRVARRWVVLAGPYQDERVAQAEELLQCFLHDKLGERHRYLDEHRQHGLPEREAVEAQMRERGARLVSIPHGNLERWLVLQCLSMYLDYDASLRGVARDFQRWYNAELYASDHAAPCYRHVVVAALDGAVLPKAERLLAPPVAPAGALTPFTKLAPALLAFDSERARWRAERQQFEQSVAILRADLDGHRAVVETALADKRRLESDLERVCAEQARERGDFQRVRADLSADLEGHRAALKSVQADLERQSAEHARALEQWALVVADRERNLEGHRAALSTLEADLAGHRTALAELRAQLDGQSAALVDLERERAAREAAEQALQRSDGDLRRVLQLASGLEKSLAQRELVYDELRRELRSRWRNFLRVFRPLR